MCCCFAQHTDRNVARAKSSKRWGFFQVVTSPSQKGAGCQSEIFGTITLGVLNEPCRRADNSCDLGLKRRLVEFRCSFFDHYTDSMNRPGLGILAASVHINGEDCICDLAAGRWPDDHQTNVIRAPTYQKSSIFLNFIHPELDPRRLNLLHSPQHRRPRHPRPRHNLRHR